MDEPMKTKQKRCAFLCPPHLDHCDLDTNEHGGAHEGDCRCEKCPTREGNPYVNGGNWYSEYNQLPRNAVFDPQVIQDAINSNLPPCTACEAEEVLAVRRNDIQYAVMKCLICRHQRQLTPEEYQTAYPDSGALPLTDDVLETEQDRQNPQDSPE
jgi:hypothetical protein